MSATYDSLTQQVAAGAGLRLKATVQAILGGFRSHASLYGVVLATYAIGLVQSKWLGVPLSLGLVEIVSGTTFIFLFLIIGLWLAGDLVRLWWTGFAGSPALALRARLLNDILAPSRIANTIHAFIANGVFFIGFLTIKKNIPIAIPFAWDESFMQLDKVLHFGVLPHDILTPLFASPLAIFLVNVNYNLWFLVLTAFFFWQGFRRDDTALRQQYLLAYLTTWLAGTCIAGTLLSSAGPCFYGFIVDGTNPYAGLMDQLRQANTIYPVWAVPTQDALWQSHLAGHGDIEGVSAMPSMHVGTTILFVLCAMRSGHRWLVWFSAIFAFSIFIGSIVLGWHYAVDGYAGALIAIACWKLSGWWLKRVAA